MGGDALDVGPVVFANVGPGFVCVADLGGDECLDDALGDDDDCGVAITRSVLYRPCSRIEASSVSRRGRAE